MAVIGVYAWWRGIQERTEANVPIVSYTRGNDLSGTLEGAGGIGGLLAFSRGYSGGNWTNHSYYFADGNGNVTYMLNSSQSMVAQYRYDPFGRTMSQSGALADLNVYRFSSKEIHTNTGMYYFGYRYYNPSTGRWLSRDPSGEEGGENLYAFANNDPQDYFDDLGAAPQPAKPKNPGKPTPPNPTPLPKLPPVPPDPSNPDKDADRKTREQFARDIMNQFQAWKNRNKCCNLDLCTLISQWMYESDWGRSAAARGKNLGGITGEGPEGSTGNFRKYHDFPQFYADYTDLICNKGRYKSAIGKKGQDFVDALKKAGYDATDKNYAENVMKIYRQLGCK